MVEAVIFDVGGTLIWGNGRRFERANAWRVALALRSEGMLASGDAGAEQFADRLEQIRRGSPKEGEDCRQIGTTRELLARVLLEFGLPDDAATLDWLEREFVTPEAQGAVAVPGMIALVNELAGRVRLGIASNTRSHLLTEATLEALGIARHFHPVVTSVSAGYRKPGRQIFEAVLSRWPVNPGAVVMVGDSRRKDVLGAQKAGMRGIWLRAERLAGGTEALAPEAVPADFEPDAVADDADSVLASLYDFGLDD